MYVHKPMVKYSGASQKCRLLQISQNIDGFREEKKQSTMLLDLVKL